MLQKSTRGAPEVARLAVPIVVTCAKRAFLKKLVTFYENTQNRRHTHFLKGSRAPEDPTKRKDTSLISENV